jgi:hypothetical protein
MPQMPVVATIRDAYNFTLTHLGSVIGLIWIPMVLLTVMGFFSSQRYYNDTIEALASGNAAQMGSSFLMWLAYLIAALLLQAVMYAAVTQLALGMRSGPVWAHFAFGQAEWRMFRSLLAFTGLVIPLFLFGSVVLNMVVLQAAQAAPAVLLIFYGLLLAAVARFFVLLPAISATEAGPLLRRAWMLTAGNFWRLLAVLLAIVIPLFILAVLLMVPVAQRLPPLPVGGSQQVQQLAMLTWVRQALPFLWGLLFLIWPLVIGLFAGASVSAWRALKNEPALDIAV